MTPLEQLERRSRLWHVQQSAEAIVEFTTGRSVADMTEDRMMRLAVERAFITIGEALARAIDADAELAKQISDSQAIIGLRNQLVHNYPRIDPARIWEIIQRDLPRLLAEVRALLAE
jgi:uncharacterized protein with HEPN domain